jgi:hypothetical protein
MATKNVSTSSANTFIVQIHHTENHTWQGVVTWAESDKRMFFRSALELLRLVDGSLDEAADKNE